MCVIFLASKTRPTEEMINRAWDNNSNGAGIAWREKDEVVWEKGIMTPERIHELCAKVPLPFVAHFRVASCGGVKDTLTHPFLVEPAGRLLLKGRTKGGVLFHNGHWNPWNEKLLDAAIASNNPLPEGNDWSDSRAMAWMMHIYGPSLMAILPSQKGILMTPKKFNIFTGGEWTKINDVWCSNDYFWTGRNRHGNTTSSYGRICRAPKCHITAQAGKDFCNKCEREIEDQAKEFAKDINNSVGQSQVNGNTVGGDSPLAKKMFLLAEVTEFHKQGIISKSTLKKYRKANEQRNERGNRGIRALETMLRLSKEIGQSLVTDGPTN